MKVLIVNTYHYLRGGDSRHALALGELLESRGHKVHYFAMNGDNNLPCEDDEYFIKEIDYRKALSQKQPLAFFKVLAHCIYSLEAKRKIGLLLDRTRPDIVHLHSIRHHLTKSIIGELKKRKLPVVWTLHDFKEICPNTSFFDGKEICESCKDNKFVNIIKKRCKKGSLSASVMTYIEAKVASECLSDRTVDYYISPSKFLKNTFVEYGYDSTQIVHLPNFIETGDITPLYEFEEYLLFVGRLENGKGIETMIRGFSKSQESGHSLNLMIAGRGSKKKELEDLAKKMKASNIHFVGFKQGAELDKLMRNAKAIVIPSELYENYPFSGLEAMAYGKAIIGSRIGGIPEQVEDGVTGFLFEPHNDDQLSEKINLLNSLPDKRIEEMGRKARQKVEVNNNKELYYSHLLKVYQSLEN